MHRAHCLNLPGLHTMRGLDADSPLLCNGIVNFLCGRGTTRAEDAQGTPTQCHISPTILVYKEKRSVNPMEAALQLARFTRSECLRPVVVSSLKGLSSSLLGPAVPSFRAFSGRLRFTVRRYKFKKDSPFAEQGLLCAEQPKP